MIRKTLCVFCFTALSFFPPAVYAQSVPAKWTGNIFFGFNQTGGNTQKGSGSLEAQAARKMESSELSLKGHIFYSESNKKMDGQKWDALSKYSFDFGREKSWYNFYQLFVDHDYFADIDYRLTPSTGLGYHILRRPEWTWDADGGLGYRVTKFRSDGTDESLTAVAHTYMKKTVFQRAALSEDITVYPSFKRDAGVSLRSETAFTNPLTEKFDLQLKYIIDHNTEPGAGKKKTDTQFIAGLNYKF